MGLFNFLKGGKKPDTQDASGMVPKATEAGSTKDSETAGGERSNQNRDFMTWGREGSADGEFKEPVGIAVAPDGSIYVSDSELNRIQKFTSEGRFITKWGFEGPNTEGNTGVFSFDSYPGKITIDAAGDVYVVISGIDSCIRKFSSKGTFISELGGVDSGDDGLFFVLDEGIAVDGAGNVYVTSSGNHHIWKLAADGTFLNKWGVIGKGDGEFGTPGSSGIAVDRAGDIYVTDDGNDRIQKFTSDGTFITTWGTKGDGDGQFRYPRDVAVDATGNIYVADCGNNRIQIFTAKGTFITKWEPLLEWVGDIKFPEVVRGTTHIAVDTAGNVYLADSKNHCIHKIKLESQVKDNFKKIYNDITKIYKEGIAFDDEGKYEKAIHCYNQALKLDPGNTDILKRRDALMALSPDISIELSNTSLTSNKWEQVDLILRNTGRVIGEDISVSFSDVADIRRTETTYTLQPGESIADTITIRSDAFGRAPLDVTVKGGYFGGRTFEAPSTIWLDISDPSTTSAPNLTGSGPATSPPDSSSLFARYQSHDLIGEGGFGRVYRANRDGRTYAVKVPKTPDSATGKTFISEIQNWTRLNHPNIVKVFDYNILPTPYFEMEYCEESLDSLPKPMSPDQAAWLIYGVCNGLHYAHSQKIIHRDLKPQNILIKEGIPKITDWGLSKVMTESKSTTSTSFTPYYAAPEQMGSQPKDERTDIWQLGAILYELVTGTVPFTGESMMEVMMGIMSRDPVKPTELNPEAKELEPVILRCLEKDPAKRFGSVTELQRVLAFYLKVTYTDALKVSQGSDDRKSAYLCGELLLIHLGSGELPKALVYGKDLIRYSSGEGRSELESLVEQMSFCIDEGLTDLPEELMRKAEWIVHGSRLEGMG